MRGTLAPSTGPTESLRVMNEARLRLASFPEVLKVVSQTGRPDDGTDTTGFFNTEYFVDLKPKDEWRPVFQQNKEELIAAMDRELEKTPGVLWSFSQPISDNVEEAVSGVKGELAIKIYGDDLKTLEEKGNQIVSRHEQDPGRAGPRPVPRHRPAQPQLHRQPRSRRALRHQRRRRAGRHPDRRRRQRRHPGARQGEARYDVVVRYLPQYRNTQEAIDNIRLLAPAGERVSLAQLTNVTTEDGAEEIYREAGQRYVAIKYSVRDRDLGSTVEEAIKQGQRAGEAAARLQDRLGRRVREPEALVAPPDAGAADHDRRSSSSSSTRCSTPASGRC